MGVLAAGMRTTSHPCRESRLTLQGVIRSAAYTGLRSPDPVIEAILALSPAVSVAL